MTFDHDYGCSFPLFSSVLKKGKKKRRMNNKKFDQKSCLSARSNIAIAILTFKQSDDIALKSFRIFGGPISFSALHYLMSCNPRNMSCVTKTNQFWYFQEDGINLNIFY